jgi:protein TonB
VKSDLYAFLVAIAAHAGMAYGLVHMPPRPPHQPSVVEVEVRKPPPPVKPLTPPPQPPPPEPPKKVVRHLPPPPAATPPPNVEPPKQPPKEPPPPVFGVNMDSTTEGDSSFTVPVGNTTMIDPAKSGKGKPVAPLPAAPAAGTGSGGFHPASELEIKELPDIDGEACGRAVPYPEEAKELGIEGEVKLRIEVDEKGGIHDIKVIKGLGHGLDQAVIYGFRHLAACRFTKPARRANGSATAYVIPVYSFRFTLER